MFARRETNTDLLRYTSEFQPTLPKAVLLRVNRRPKRVRTRRIMSNHVVFKICHLLLANFIPTSFLMVIHHVVFFWEYIGITLTFSNGRATLEMSTKYLEKFKSKNNYSKTLFWNKEKLLLPDNLFKNA